LLSFCPLACRSGRTAAFPLALAVLAIPFRLQLALLLHIYCLVVILIGAKNPGFVFAFAVTAAFASFHHPKTRSQYSNIPPFTLAIKP
jgi:hypothetical protein